MACGDWLPLQLQLMLLATALLVLNTVAAAAAASASSATLADTPPPPTHHREHKVHNIVLYPDKHSWCRTTTIKQVISYPGCRPVEIDNNVCVGACFSYSIPHTEPSDPGEVIVPYCDSCQPSETRWHDVTLDCSATAASATLGASATPAPAITPVASSGPAAAAAASPFLDASAAAPQLVKRVQVITNCSCAPCDRGAQQQPPAKATTASSATDGSASANSLPSSMGGSGGGDEPQHDTADVAPLDDSAAALYELPMNDGPDLLNELQRRHNNNESSSGNRRRPEGLRLLMDNRIVELLQRIQETNQPEDRQQLKMFLQMIQVDTIDIDMF